MNNKYDLIIIGAGAAGLAAGVAYGRRSSGCALIIEKEQKAGKKLLATGNGRCNLTNLNLSEKCYNIDAHETISTVLKRIPPERLIELFTSLGIPCREDGEGRVYPYSGRAAAVRDMLMLHLQNRGVEVKLSTCAEKIEQTGGVYRVICGEEIFTAKKLIISTGGAVQKALGSDGSSYRFADDLSLKCAPIFPSLAPVVVSDKALACARGARCAAFVSVSVNGKIIRTERGELQFNEKNISGICIFQLSRIVNEALAEKNNARIEINADLAPDFSLAELKNMTAARCKALPNAPADTIFTGIINEKLIVYLYKKTNIPHANRTLSNVSQSELDKLCRAVKKCVFIPSRISDFDSAQVTAGGILTSNVDRNFRAGEHGGLYIVGEALNVDGDCGGYNLHFAFSSGIIAGTHAAKSEVTKHDKNK